MADSPSQTPASAESEEGVDRSEYWCYNCNKRVAVETLANLPDVICHECKNGFVESIPATSPPPSAPPSITSDQADDPSFGSQFLQVLRLIAQAAQDEDAPPPPPQDHNPGDDFLRIELDGWDNDEDEDYFDGDDANENENQENRGEGEDNRGREMNEVSDEENEENRDEDEEDPRRRRQDVLRLRLRDLATRPRTGRNRILDWAEILMGLEDNSIEFRFEVPESDRYVGNPEDYVDAAGYEALLQNLAESDGGRRGAPPASKSAISGLPKVKILLEEEVMLCAICKDMVNVGDTATKLPCGHGYHADCIVPWLGSRNSCPVCRFELPTDDAEYEEERKKKFTPRVGGASGSGGDSSGSS
ncbi:E3 ubiquitin-protein ligase CIP8-like [Tripterygium wilfordii]|uniref:RING-type E3 ubiquitin transferase n=1 Tax=Tripterygium wilfordii TaxID=458696 RepID=A0A7J7D3E8_TRIWF|nr:E3 ubiquitin-protein ligase CIP8-like [Tripterygium wilfordii]XP_038716086.1 E3 ubiquitin-protein ligase CIP8-like [Tripterygium wilfordii]KAF5740877.1 E3 ubiquitin-protein ligase CIP8-like [Tripterygium wilfordii]